MEFVFYNEVTGEEIIFFADDLEAAEAMLRREVTSPELWRVRRDMNQLPSGMYDSDD